MGRFPRYLIAFAFCLFAQQSFAAVQWTGTNLGGSTSSGYSSYSAALAWAASTGFGASYTSRVVSTTPQSYGYLQVIQVVASNGAIAGTYNTKATLVCSSPNALVAGTPPSCSGCPAGTAWQVSSGTCASVTCNSAAGTKADFTGSGVSQITFCGSDFCNYVSKGFRMDMVTSSGPSWAGSYVSDGSACSPGTSPPTKSSSVSPSVNAAGSSINKSTGCGTVVGVPYCVGAQQSGTCGKTAGGSEVCTATTPGSSTPPSPVATPPAPDTGVAGTPASPIATVSSDGSITSSGGQSGASTSTFYSPSQASASTVGASTIATTNASGTGAPGAPDVVTVTNPSDGSQDSDCHTQNTCTDATGATGSDVPTDAKDFGDSTSDFYASLGSSPIGVAMSSFGSSFPSGGSVPSASFDALGRTYTLTPPQAVIDAITSVLVWIMRAVWSVMAIRRFMEA